MYVIVTSKPGLFHTELTDGLEPIEAYDYVFGDTKRAHFVIAALRRDIKVVVVDEAEPPVVNRVPSKFLEKFDQKEDCFYL